MAENPIRKEDIIDGDAIQRELQETTKELDNLIDKMQELVMAEAAAKKASTEGLNPALKQDRAAIQENAKAINDLLRTSKELAKAKDQLNKASKETGKTLKAEAGSYNDLADKLKTLRNQFKNTADDGLKNKLLPQIDRLDKRLKDIDKSMGVHNRNVGNYGSAFKSAATQMLGFIGVTGGITGALDLISKGWKRIQENIELYLNSADKLAAGPAAFERDAEKALEDTRRRARGQVAEGIRVQQSAQRELALYGHTFTEAQKEALVAQRESAIKMQEEGAAILKSLRLEKDRTDWKVKYNAMLVEEERINDEKLAKETRFEELEARLVQQRAKSMDMSATDAEKREAAVKAEEIANQLRDEKLALINRELENLEGMAEMTNKQEVYEERINQLLKQRNTIQKEYESDQIKVNRLQKAGMEDTIKLIKTVEKERAYSAEEALKKQIDTASKVSTSLVNVKKAEIKQTAEADITNAEFQKESQRQVTEEKLRSYADEADKYLEIASLVNDSFASILEKRKQKELSAAGDNAKERERIEKEYANKEKALAITSALINTAGGVTRALKDYPYPLSAVIGAIVGGLGAVQIGLIASQKFAEGGYTGDGSFRDETGEKVAGVVHQEEYVIPKEPTRKYRRLLEAIHSDNPMAIAEELRNRQFHQVWGGVQPKIAEAYRQDPYTMAMYHLMKNSVTTYEDSNGATVLRFADGTTKVIKKK